MTNDEDNAVEEVQARNRRGLYALAVNNAGRRVKFRCEFEDEEPVEYPGRLVGYRATKVDTEGTHLIVETDEATERGWAPNHLGPWDRLVADLGWPDAVTAGVDVPGRLVYVDDEDLELL